MTRLRHIVGCQVHHSVKLDDASRYGANMATALRSAAVMVHPDYRGEIESLHAEVGALLSRIGVVSEVARLRIQLFQSDPEFKRYVDGDLAWPDEDPAGFLARCRCDDACLFHDQGIGTEQDCNCAMPCFRDHESEAS